MKENPKGKTEKNWVNKLKKSQEKRNVQKKKLIGAPYEAR